MGRYEGNTENIILINAPEEAMDLVDNSSSDSAQGENRQQSKKREIALEGSDVSDDDSLRVNEKFAKR